MNKEQQELLDEAYENYCTEYENGTHLIDTGLLWMAKETKDTFIYRSKTDSKFSQKWGLEIEERELSLEEKEWQLEKTNCINDIENDRIIYGHEWEKYIQGQYEGIQSSQGIKIPIKLITITYNDKTIERYE
jgi:hypothetical protein